MGFVISSLRGGLNGFDPPTAIGDDQCTVATNVEFFESMLGERRRGGVAIDITGSGLDACLHVAWLQRHLPTEDPADSELWALGVTAGLSPVLAKKNTAWSNPTIKDAFVVDNSQQHRVRGLSYHGKLFVAYESAVNRGHVYDGSTLRRMGLAQPAAAPTAADDGGSGTFSGDRYYRVRFIAKSGSTVLRRSEPSDTLTFSPNGNDTGAVVTRPTAINEGETHWELEASLDNANFYVIAEVVLATTTSTDTTDFSAGYTAYELSEDIGDYTVPHSAEFLLADEDRLLLGGSFEDPELQSRVSWTPVLNDDGVGSDERIPLDPVSFLDLDAQEGGGLTGMVSSDGAIWVFKRKAIYKLIRTGIRTRAYDAIAITKERGALPGSIVEGVDQMGRPAVYFYDENDGPCRITRMGITRCGLDVDHLRESINLDSVVTARALYYPAKRQVKWWLAGTDANSPTFLINLQTNEQRDGQDGARRGWSYWTGNIATALTACLYSANIDDDDDRSNDLVPFVGMIGLGFIWQLDTGDDDNGTAFAGRVQSKPRSSDLGLLTQFGVAAAGFVAAADDDATVNMRLTTDFGVNGKTIGPVPLAPVATETQVVTVVDDLALSEGRVMQVEFIDPDTPTGRWAINRFEMRETAGTSS